MRPILALAAAFIVTALPALACETPANLSALRTEVVAGINAARADAGLPAVRELSTLTAVAQSHACDNAARGSIAHTGSDGRDLTARLRDAGYRFATAAENTGRGFGSADRAVAWWMASPLHRANILNRAVRDVGVGVAIGDGTPYWVVDFGASR